MVGDWTWREQNIPLGNNNTLRIYYVYADYVIDDEQQRYAPGNWARSSPLTALHDKCVFETANTLYVLVNRDLDEKNTGTSYFTRCSLGARPHLNWSNSTGLDSGYRRTERWNVTLQIDSYAYTLLLS